MVQSATDRLSFSTLPGLLFGSAHGCGTQHVIRHASSPAVAEALQSLAQDLAHGNSAAKERAVAMLSSLTLYVDHHDAILATPGVLQALLASVADERLVPQASNNEQMHPCYLAGCGVSAHWSCDRPQLTCLLTLLSCMKQHLQSP